MTTTSTSPYGDTIKNMDTLRQILTETLKALEGLPEKSDTTSKRLEAMLAGLEISKTEISCSWYKWSLERAHEELHAEKQRNQELVWEMNKLKTKNK